MTTNTERKILLFDLLLSLFLFSTYEASTTHIGKLFLSLLLSQAHTFSLSLSLSDLSTMVVGSLSCRKYLPLAERYYKNFACLKFEPFAYWETTQKVTKNWEVQKCHLRAGDSNLYCQNFIFLLSYLRTNLPTYLSSSWNLYKCDP